MAKKKHKSGSGDVANDAGKGLEQPAAKPAAAAKSAADGAAASDAPIDVAYRSGNFGGVRALAASAPDAHAADLIERIKIDPQQVLIGAITLFVVAFAAFLTLR